MICRMKDYYKMFKEEYKIDCKDIQLIYLLHEVMLENMQNETPHV